MARHTRKLKGKRKDSSLRDGSFTSRWSRSKGKGEATAYYADYVIYDDYDCNDDVLELAGACQAYHRYR